MGVIFLWASIHGKQHHPLVMKRLVALDEKAAVWLMLFAEK